MFILVYLVVVLFYPLYIYILPFKKKNSSHLQKIMPPIQVESDLKILMGTVTLNIIIQKPLLEGGGIKY